MGESVRSSAAGNRRPPVQRVEPVPFHAHVELLELFLARRDTIVERIEELLNARKKPIQDLQDVALQSRHFKDCFFTLTGITREQSRLRDQLEAAHWASGFRPRTSPGLHNDLVDPADMMVRGFHLWSQTHWPGHSGRVRYAQTLFNLYLIRKLALLTMRLWDSESSGAGDRLSEVQGLLDQIWTTSPMDQPVLVRDARWLIPVVQSPTTDELAGYFEVAERVAESLPEADQIEIQNASVRMGGGHLRSQLLHVSTKEGVSVDETSLILSTRKSNALDLALLTEGLVPLLDAYEDACEQANRSGDSQKRLELAAAICQGISPDPELFLNRLDLLAPYSMIEHLFITADRDGQAVYTPMGQRHVRLIGEYTAKIGRVSRALHEDCQRLKPVDGAYSPYGAIYGFSSVLIELMAFKALQRDAVTDFSLEDVFVGGDLDKCDWVSGWRKLPHVKPEVARRFEYPREFAQDIFARIEQALARCVSDSEANASARNGRLFIVRQDDGRADSDAPDLPVRYILSSDVEIVAAHKAVAFDQTRLLQGRLEGEYVVSYETSGGWVAITKDVLTEVLGAGHDVKVAGLPGVAAGVSRLMCPEMTVIVGA